MIFDSLHIGTIDIIIYVIAMLIVLFGGFNKLKDEHDNIDEFYFFWRDFFPKFYDNWIIACFWGLIGLIVKDEIGYPLVLSALPLLKEHLPTEAVLDKSLTFASVFLFGRYIKKFKEK